ncbi:hypothetical protein E2C01_015333 [Portunus trituberculatus]|uniref:Uncharacterized protein n=1 Tax=Portunus trituberculatus TaxID=210409 RepID=A0A5B7DMP7_PORTR|nr:hypothetical protein [Portunus trituberculatus]
MKWTTPSQAPHPSTSQSSAPARSHWALHNSSRKRDEWRRCLTARPPARPSPTPLPPRCNYQVRKCKELRTGSQKQTLHVGGTGDERGGCSPLLFGQYSWESPTVTLRLPNHRVTPTVGGVRQHHHHHYYHHHQPPAARQEPPQPRKHLSMWLVRCVLEKWSPLLPLHRTSLSPVSRGAFCLPSL